MYEKHWVLKNSNLFSRLTESDLNWLESRSRLKTFQKNSPIYLPADSADGVLVLAAGRVKICSMTPEGKQSILALISPGEIFGELSIFDDNDREEYAEATEDSSVVLIPLIAMRELVERNPQLALGVTKLLGFRRRRIERRLKYLLFRSNRDRLIHLLLELAEDYGTHSEPGVEIKIKLSHQDLASIIGSTRETVTVTLGQLQAEGLIKVGRRRLLLINVGRLAECIRVKPPVLRREPAMRHPPVAKQMSSTSGALRRAF